MSEEASYVSHKSRIKLNAASFLVLLGVLAALVDYAVEVVGEQLATLRFRLTEAHVSYGARFVLWLVCVVGLAYMAMAVTYYVSSPKFRGAAKGSGIPVSSSSEKETMGKVKKTYSIKRGPGTKQPAQETCCLVSFIPQHPLLTFFVLLLLLLLLLFLLLCVPLQQLKIILSGIDIPSYLRFDTLCAKAIGLALAVGSGLFVGKEGPFVHIATALAHKLTELPMFIHFRDSGPVMLQIQSAAA